MIYAIGIDWEQTPVEQREYFSVEETVVNAFLHKMLAVEFVDACVLLQTCNRFELYIDARSREGARDLQKGLGSLVGYPADRALPEIFCFEAEEAGRRLMEIASGLRSQVLGEDQIISQVRNAIKTARAAGAADPALETLFRLAVTAGKAVRTHVKLQAVPRSSAHKALQLVLDEMGSLQGKRAVVIGNGVMGRLAAELLAQEGCFVEVTLRSMHHHGQTVVPAGCETVPYEDRFKSIGEADVVVSATRSPHFTITHESLSLLSHKPSVLIDMAVPRDIEPTCRSIDGIAFYDMDDLGDMNGREEEPAWEKATAIIDKYLADYRKWDEGRKRYQASAAKLAIFAGTTEGRNLCKVLSEAGIPATVFVATEYGSATLPDYTGIEVCAGRLDEREMMKALKGYTQVVDATHPYAAAVSRNISEAAERVGAEYIRLMRPSTDASADMVTVENSAAAAAYLANTTGPVLLTTGSKDLADYTTIPDFAARLHPRILPDAQALARCIELGYSPANIVCMQGPFTHDMNSALLSSINAQWVVTKDSGKVGGVVEKLSAAKQAGASIIMIARPEEKQVGQSFDEVCERLVGKRAAKPKKALTRFPLFVDLADKPCLVVGAGAVGMRRCRVLQDFGARITLIAPAVHGNLPEASVCHLAGSPQSPAASSGSSRLRYLCREFQPGDTEGMELVVAATNSRAVNHMIAQECAHDGIPVSVSDCPEECSFFFPAVGRSSRLCAGIVSGGEDHALVTKTAAAIRRTLEVYDV